MAEQLALDLGMSDDLNGLDSEASPTYDDLVRAVRLLQCRLADRSVALREARRTIKEMLEQQRGDRSYWAAKLLADLETRIDQFKREHGFE